MIVSTASLCAMKNAKNTTVPAAAAHVAGAIVHRTARTVRKSTELIALALAKLASAQHVHPANIAPSLAEAHFLTIKPFRIFKWCWLKHARFAFRKRKVSVFRNVAE